VILQYVVREIYNTRYRPGAGETMLPADGSSTVAKIAADLRPSADESAVHTSLVVGGG